MGSEGSLTHAHLSLSRAISIQYMPTITLLEI